MFEKYSDMAVLLAQNENIFVQKGIDFFSY